MNKFFNFTALAILTSPLSVFAQDPLDGKWQLVDQACNGVSEDFNYDAKIEFDGNRATATIMIESIELKSGLAVEYLGDSIITLDQLPEDKEAALNAELPGLVVEKETVTYRKYKNGSDEMISVEGTDSLKCKGVMKSTYKKI